METLPRFICDGRAYIGWTADDAVAVAGVPPEIVAAAVLAADRERMRCTMRQARIAIAGVGLLEKVDSWAAAQDQATRITWEYATEILRTDPLVIAAGTAIGLSDTDLDALFTTAQTL